MSLQFCDLVISRLQLLGAPEKQAVGAGWPCQSPQNRFAAALLFVKIGGKISLWTVFPLRYLLMINRLDTGWFKFKQNNLLDKI